MSSDELPDVLGCVVEDGVEDDVMKEDDALKKDDEVKDVKDVSGK